MSTKSFEGIEYGNSFIHPESDFELSGREHLEQQAWQEHHILDSELFERLQEAIPTNTDESPAIEEAFESGIYSYPKNIDKKYTGINIQYAE